MFVFKSGKNLGWAPLLVLLVTPITAQYRVVSLVGNEQDLGHHIPVPGHIDHNLANGWGLAFLPTGPFWVSDELTGFSTIYGADGTIEPLVVTIPKAPSDPLPPGSPTGIVANPHGGFVISEKKNSGSALFIFATLDGTISGWNPMVNLTNAVIALDNSAKPAAYTGLAIANTKSGAYIYAANAVTNQIEKYNSKFKLVKTFGDASIPPPFAVYGVAALRSHIYVTYATVLPGKPGAGFVDVFDEDGKLEKTLISATPGGPLNVPWGLAIAPSNFGKFSDALLVGNLQDGRINAFNGRNRRIFGLAPWLRWQTDRNPWTVGAFLWRRHRQ
ncbi:MAG: TIGR03118 family protein [Acidobacteriaceae bacterium]|nr:TIGR03118 family protein [Acidobacteriaceae bacterium]MBV9780710.1 TIGR03118 family protein [Acidobacteriaceae bacterium]